MTEIDLGQRQAVARPEHRGTTETTISGCSHLVIGNPRVLAPAEGLNVLVAPQASAFDQDHLEPAVLEFERQGNAGRSRTHDADVGAEGLAFGKRSQIDEHSNPAANRGRPSAVTVPRAFTVMLSLISVYRSSPEDLSDTAKSANSCPESHRQPVNHWFGPATVGSVSHEADRVRWLAVSPSCHLRWKPPSP